MLWYSSLLLPADAHIKADNLPQNAAATSPQGGVNNHPSFSPTNPTNKSAQEPNSKPFTINPARAEIDLLDIETRRQVFSPVLLSPDRRAVAFSEVLYYPHQARVLSTIFIQPLPAPPSLADTHQLPEEYYAQRVQEALNQRQQDRDRWMSRAKHWVWPFGKDHSPPKPEPIQPIFDPAATNSIRKQIYSVGAIGNVDSNPTKYADHVNNTPHLQTDIEGNLLPPKTTRRRRFETLTPVDYSADGQKLLFKHKTGQLYDILTVTQLLVYDMAKPEANAVDIYPQLHQAVDYYWTTQGIIPPMTEQVWDVVPLGWRPGSSTEVETKAWAYTKTNRIFLGHWRVDITTGVPKLIDVMDNPVPVAANGAWVNIPGGVPSRI